MDETPICGSRSMEMLFDLCVVHPSLWGPGQFESMVDRIAEMRRLDGSLVMIAANAMDSGRALVMLSCEIL